MTGPKRDWDKELADIDKLMAAPPAPAAGRPAAPATRQAGPAAVSRREALGAWLRVGLGVAAGAAVSQWPYAHACGLGLWLYLGAAATVVVAGFWGLIASWRRRLGLAHVVALAVLLWGAILVAGVILPRVGYARTAAAWTCP
ncbi:MAG: hypothetical protein ACRENB_14760 [Gemmatimonadales bacterium]